MEPIIELRLSILQLFHFRTAQVLNSFYCISKMSENRGHQSGHDAKFSLTEVNYLTFNVSNLFQFAFRK